MKKKDGATYLCLAGILCGEDVCSDLHLALSCGIDLLLRLHRVSAFSLD